jgi:plastocyanin domain-containing protein
MNPSYNDENNAQMPLQPVPVQTSGGFMNYVKNNKLTVAIVIIILIALIWWFCMRKPNTSSVSTIPGKNTTLQVTKQRASTLY